MKLSKLVNPQYQQTLMKLSAQELPLRTAFRLKGIIKTGNEELVKYDEVRNDALKRFGTRKEDGELEIDEKGNVKFSEENMKSFVDELNALLDAEVALGSIKIQDLGDKVSLTTQELIVLDDLIVD